MWVAQNGKLSISLDARSNGNMKQCVTDLDLGLPADWNKNAVLGITATTGQLADNHDILSLLFRCVIVVYRSCTAAVSGCTCLRRFSADAHSLTQARTRVYLLTDRPCVAVPRLARC